MKATVCLPNCAPGGWQCSLIGSMPAAGWLALPGTLARDDGKQSLLWAVGEPQSETGAHAWAVRERCGAAVGRAAS